MPHKNTVLCPIIIPMRVLCSILSQWPMASTSNEMAIYSCENSFRDAPKGEEDCGSGQRSQARMACVSDIRWHPQGVTVSERRTDVHNFCKNFYIATVMALKNS